MGLFKLLKYFFANVQLEMAIVTAEEREKMLTSQTHFNSEKAIVHHRESHKENKM